MSFTSAALLTRAVGPGHRGYLGSPGRPKQVRSSVLATALTGALLATVAFGVFLIPGYVVGLVLFSGPPSPTIALFCTLLADLIWLVLAAVRSI